MGWLFLGGVGPQLSRIMPVAKAAAKTTKATWDSASPGMQNSPPFFKRPGNFPIPLRLWSINNMLDTKIAVVFD